jgi:hypothetical protein
MKDEPLTYKQKLNIMQKLGDLYRTALRRIDMSELSGGMTPASIRDDINMKNLMERTLKDCSADTKLIAGKDFLEISDKKWYATYYSQSAYYRKKKKAVEEFLELLDSTQR